MGVEPARWVANAALVPSMTLPLGALAPEAVPVVFPPGAGVLFCEQPASRSIPASEIAMELLIR